MENTIYEVEPAVKFVGRVSLLVDADCEEEAIARAERAVVEEDWVDQEAFNRVQETQLNMGPSAQLVGDSLVYDWGPESDLPSKGNPNLPLTCADDEIDRAEKRRPDTFTVIGYNKESAARVRMVICKHTPEDAVRAFFESFAQKNYADPSFDYGCPIGELEEELGVLIISCHEGDSNERVHEAVPYA